MKLTLKEIKKANPCTDGWNKLLKGLGKTEADDEPLKLKTILEINDLSDACWVADRVLGLEKELRLYAFWNAKQSKKYVQDKKKYDKVLNTVNLFAYGAVSASARQLALTSASASTSASALASTKRLAWDIVSASASASAWASAYVSTSDAVSASAYASANELTWVSARELSMLKSKKTFIRIVCNGILPKKVSSENHF